VNADLTGDIPAFLRETPALIDRIPVDIRGVHLCYGPGHKHIIEPDSSH